MYISQRIFLFRFRCYQVLFSLSVLDLDQVNFHLSYAPLNEKCVGKTNGIYKQLKSNLSSLSISHSLSKQTETMNKFAVALVLALFVQIVWMNQVEDKESPLQLLRQGKLSMGATYAHLHFPIKTARIEDSFDDLEDILEAYERHATQGGAATALKYSVSRLHSKISLMRGFVRPGQLHSAFLEDSENQIEDALTRLRLSREKRSLDTIVPWIGLAGFGTSLYTSGQVATLKNEFDNQSSAQHLISQKLEFQSLRISNLTRYIQSYHKQVLDTLTHLSAGTKKAAMELHGRSLQLTLEVFKNEVKDFIIGLNSLMEGRLHPLLIEPSKLYVAYQDLVNKAIQQGLTPLHEDPSILFTCPTSTLATTEIGDLIVIVHVPVNTGILNLYRFISAPIKLENQNSVTISIKTEAEYLAIDSEQTRGGQYLARQIDGCRSYQGVRHCPSINFLTRNLTSLCLYNVMMMQLEYIRQNCQILVNPMRQEIHPLGVNHYLLFSPSPTSISYDCSSNRKQVKTFEGQLYLTMIEECPVAYTMGYTFTFTASVYLRRKIVYLPTLYKIDKWFADDSLSSELEENTLSHMNELLTAGLADFDNVKDGIPLIDLVERIQHRSKTFISWCFAILQQIMALIAAVYFSYKVWHQFKLKLLPIIRSFLPTCIRRKPTRYHSVPILQNVPLRRIPKPRDDGAVSQQARLPKEPSLSPV